MIQTKEYQDSVDKINRIRSYGLSKMITIPQIAILGDQSSGKSSVLEAITKLSFPRNIETCTRFATQVSLRQDDTPQMSASIDGESDFNNKYRTRDTQDCNWDVHGAVTEAKKILCADSDISEKVLEITISGPSLLPLTIIDLPGEAERYDPEKERTIPIVTKPDAVEQDLLPNLIQTILNKRKFMKLGYLVMRNSSYKDIDMPWDDARRLEEEFFKSSPLWSHVPDANKGRVSVTTFLGELLYSHIQKELPSFRKDILQLVSKYEKEIFDLGQPLLSTSMARARYIDSIFKLRTLLVAFLAGDYSFEYISQYKSAFEKQSSVATDNDDNNDDDDDDVYDYADDDCEPLLLELESDYRFIRSSLFRHYQRYNVVMSKKKFMLPTNKISDLVLRYKGNELPGFISFSTFTKIYMETLSRWNDLTKEHMHNINQFLYKAINRFIAFSADPLIKDMLLLEFDRFYNSQIAKIETEIDNIFKDERTPFTMNKNYYDSILKSREANAEGQIQQLINSMNTMSTMNGTQIKAVIQQHLQSFSNVSRFSDVNYNEQLAIEDLQEQLKSYCKVARKRLVDVLLQQTIERHLINSVNLYFDMLIAMDDNAINRLIESPAKQAQRKELDHKVDVLKRSLLEL
ncbi:MAG: P-loop containing nucleoside triphosphate hydrolase protein [Linnemannia gamsii]|nr:MAG: P-loop containing nucleoside triphosphate hydrolase protein [Linnemannia gamsii]